LYNYITAKKTFRCNETITFTTHGDFRFLDNLQPLLVRWGGPVSVSMYAPGDDFEKSVETIFYYRDCSALKLVRDLVTFHLFFEEGHVPENFTTVANLKNKSGNCSSAFSWEEEYVTYKIRNNLDYPVNVARNVARETAQTHFVFASDIELYPAPNTIPTFLEMVQRGEERTCPQVYVNPIFEIKANATLPNNKVELLEMLGNGSVIPFHKHICAYCHTVPNFKKWTTDKIKPGMSVMHVGKRVRPFHHWEPIYIGTNSEPVYDERLSWEGRYDKMTQGYTMCLMEYDFNILDNAFLIHRPGIKTMKSAHIDKTKVGKQNYRIKAEVYPLINKIFGTKTGCEMW